MKTSTPSSSADIARAIRAAGARVTAPRQRALAVLRAARRPLSHGDIEAALAADGQGGLDRVTLYRVLDWLVGAGLALKAADARGIFRFSATQPDSEHTSHVHFRCTGCGGVFCLKAAPPPRPRLPRGFRLTAMDVDIRGQCPRCAGESR